MRCRSTNSPWRTTPAARRWKRHSPALNEIIKAVMGPHSGSVSVAAEEPIDGATVRRCGWPAA